jgi:copper oxidase (laccase) domain-containing protein
VAILGGGVQSVSRLSGSFLAGSLETQMDWKQFLEADRAMKAAIVEALSSGEVPVLGAHQAICRQMITEHQRHIADIDAMDRDRATDDGFEEVATSLDCTSTSRRSA